MKDETKPKRTRKKKEVVTESPPQQKLVGRIRLNKSHKLFKFDTKTLLFTEMKVLGEPYEADTSDTIKKQIIVVAEEGCIYVTALNFKNAVKKLANYHGIIVKID